jgi:methylmalonyl-CoA mutase
MSINDFGPNLSFFFSNGVDPEYAVIGRVAKNLGESHENQNTLTKSPNVEIPYSNVWTFFARKIDFNDIRTSIICDI